MCVCGIDSITASPTGVNGGLHDPRHYPKLDRVDFLHSSSNGWVAVVLLAQTVKVYTHSSEVVVAATIAESLGIISL